MTTVKNKSPDEFNRSVLDMSFTLLRNKEPKLALLIRNILFHDIEAKAEDLPQNKNSDVFKIDLDSFQVRAIVENLHEVLIESQQLDPDKNTSIFRPVLIESILNEWLGLAQLMFSELQKESH
jgi:hypothetical protein